LSFRVWNIAGANEMSSEYIYGRWNCVRYGGAAQPAMMHVDSVGYEDRIYVANFCDFDWIHLSANGIFNVHGQTSVAATCDFVV
jgi:hypothetical protein